MALIRLDENMLTQYKARTKEIQKQAMDMVALPVVQEGYKLSGYPASTVFLNVTSMANRRLSKFYPMGNLKDPLFARLMSEIKYIVADCIRQKYECREQRIPFNHLKEIDRRVDWLMTEHLPTLQIEYLAMEVNT